VSASQRVQAMPPRPQKSSEGVWQTLSSQQPFGQEPAVHLQAPSTQASPSPHAGPSPQRQAPPEQVSALEPHALQAMPPVPQNCAEGS